MPVVCGVAIVAVLRFGAPTITPAAPSPTPSASPAAADTPAPDYAAAVAKLKTADALYDYIDKNATTEDIQPDDALTHDEQVAQVRKLVDGKIALLRPAIDTFLKQYPQDPRHWEVQLQRVFFLKDAENISDEDSVNTLKAVATAPDASNNAHHRARAVLLQNDLEEVDPSKGLTDDLEKELAAYEKDFPDDESGKDLVQLRVRLLQAGAPDKINPTLETLTRSPNKSTAEAAGAQLTIRTKPVDWKFDNAVDGKAVDLSKLHGKVVLLDFWATWCAPCMAKLPEIVALNKKYQDKGFQVVGVSFDQDKDALLKVVKAKHMDWPEYFDGKSFDGETAVRFNVDAIPDAWLVDRQGFLHPVDREADLDEEISKLLAAKP